MAKQPEKLTKEDLRKPDAFMRTMEQSFSFTTRYGKPIAAVLAVTVVIALGLVIATFISDRKESAAAKALFQPQSEYVKLRSQYDQAKFGSASPQEPNSPKPVPASGDMQKDFGSVLPGLQAVVKDHSGTVASAQAAVYLASIYQDYGKLDEAKATVAGEVKVAKNDSLMHSVLHLVHGNILASQGNCQEAVNSYAQVKNFLSVDAAVKAGVCYEKLGQVDKAAEMYKKASEDTQSSTALAAKGLLRALEQKRQSQSNQAG